MQIMWSVGLILCSYVLFVHCDEKPNIWPWNIQTVPLPKPLQSPIDVNSKEIKLLDMPPLQYNNFSLMGEKDVVQCQNDGMTFQCALVSKSRIPSLTGGPLTGRYIFHNLHFHWGANDSYGSEHKIDGKRWPSEMHLVTYHDKYDDIMTAMKHQDGLAIISFFGELTKNDNKDFTTLFNDAKKLASYNASTNRSWSAALPFADKLINPSDGVNQNWITYPGALPVPPFFWESVTWIIRENTFKISKEQLATFRKLQRDDGTPNIEHSMPEVPLGNNRHVYRRVTR